MKIPIVSAMFIAMPAISFDFPLTWLGPWIMQMLAKCPLLRPKSRILMKMNQSSWKSQCGEVLGPAMKRIVNTKINLSVEGALPEQNAKPNCVRA